MITEEQRQKVLKALRDSYANLTAEHTTEKEFENIIEAMEIVKNLIIPIVSSSALKSDLLADIKMSCDGTYSDAIDDWDLVDTAEDVINRINKTVDKHYC